MNRHKVMVVEDDSEIREALLEILEENGCDAVGAVNGERALAYLRSTDSLPCLILLDLMMPVMDGHEFRQCQHEDATLARIPVIVMTAGRPLPPFAMCRRCEKTDRISCVNILTGWTVVGWIASLIWAIVDRPQHAVVATAQG